MLASDLRQPTHLRLARPQHARTACCTLKRATTVRVTASSARGSPRHAAAFSGGLLTQPHVVHLDDPAPQASGGLEQLKRYPPINLAFPGLEMVHVEPPVRSLFLGVGMGSQFAPVGEP